MSDIMLVWKKCRAHLCLEEIMFKIQTEAAAGESIECVSVKGGGIWERHTAAEAVRVGAALNLT